MKRPHPNPLPEGEGVKSAPSMAPEGQNDVADL
jgi:hypothetical protein